MMKLNSCVRTAVLFLSTMAVSAGASALVTRTYNDIKMTGAQNVEVFAGSFYDVEFGDIVPPTLGLVTDAFAAAASKALLEQVFAQPILGDSYVSPDSIRGCDNSGSCAVWTATHRTVNQNVPGTFIYIGQGAILRVINGIEETDLRTILISGTFDDPTSRVSTDWTMASWSASSVAVVPEPETYSMMLAGLGAMGAIARRRKTRQTT